MKLPNVELAIVEQTKVCEYLLNASHRFGASKHRFFSRFGFTLEAWRDFAVALRRHGLENEVVRSRETGFGIRYEVDGELAVPDGRRPNIRTVWQIDADQSAPRLITAYPLEAET